MERSMGLLSADYLYAQLTKSSRSKNDHYKWSLICAFDGEEGNSSTLKRIVNSHKFQAYERHRALYFFNALNNKGVDVFEDEDLLRGYVMVARYLGYRLREIKNWKPKSYNRYRIFSDLIRFLYAQYPVPAFMDSAFMDTNPIYALWFIHIAQGRSVRKLPNCPIKMTARMAHVFMQTPPQYSVVEALRYAQIISMGGDERVIKSILATPIGQSFENDDFWETVIRFFIQNPMLEHSRFQPIVDYIQHVKYESRIDVSPHNFNERIELPPSQPHFSMKGRTVAALLNTVEEWHRTINQETKQRGFKQPLFWAAVPIKNFKYREGKSDENLKMYEIIQLITSPALLKEGRTMHHCVYSYTHSCVTGRTSIWSMTVEDAFGDKTNILTIEVSMPTNTIVQVRGKYNRLPTDVEMKVVNRWADKEGLSISKWVRY